MKKQVNLDKNGVPYLDWNDIEDKAEEVIRYFGKGVLENPGRTPLCYYLEELKKQFKLVFEYAKDLGCNADGKKILGTTSQKPLGIYIDSSLKEDPRLCFTLAHEFGHLVLHRDIDLKRIGYAEQAMIDTQIDLISGHRQLRTPREWIEWQANYFAGAILMPRDTVKDYVIRLQKDAGIIRNQGTIYLDKQSTNLAAYIEIQRHLQRVYGVPGVTVEYRLKDLRILNDRREEDVRHISELFKTR